MKEARGQRTTIHLVPICYLGTKLLQLFPILLIKPDHFRTFLSWPWIGSLAPEQFSGKTPNQQLHQQDAPTQHCKDSSGTSTLFGDLQNSYPGSRTGESYNFLGKLREKFQQLKYLLAGKHPSYFGRKCTHAPVMCCAHTSIFTEYDTLHTRTITNSTMVRISNLTR